MNTAKGCASSKLSWSIKIEKLKLFIFVETITTVVSYTSKLKKICSKWCYFIRNKCTWKNICKYSSGYSGPTFDRRSNTYTATAAAHCWHTSTWSQWEIWSKNDPTDMYTFWLGFSKFTMLPIIIYIVQSLPPNITFFYILKIWILSPNFWVIYFLTVAASSQKYKNRTDFLIRAESISKSFAVELYLCYGSVPIKWCFCTHIYIALE